MKTIMRTPKISNYIILVFTLSACGSYSNAAFQGYVGEVQPIEELSTIKLGKNVLWLEVNGHRISRPEFSRMIVLPGINEMKWGTYFSVSVLVNSSMKDRRTWTGSINLQPGHTYTINASRTLGIGYTVNSWVEDNSGGKAEMESYIRQIWKD